jgi:hypothetical protein
MKTRVFLILLMAVALFSCQKEKDPVATQQEITFSATIVEPNLKNSEDWLCVAEETPTNAWVVVNGASYYPALFELDGKLYTQAIKVDSDLDGIEYCVSQFVLYKEVNGSEGVGAGDIVVFGTPQPDSDYEVYIDEDYRLPYCFTIEGFMKYEIPIEVLCFEEADYDYFGFFWFNITEIVIREQCFFGDLCLKHIDDYDGSLYEGQLNGLQIDMPAIFKLYVFKEGVAVPYSPFSNEAWLGEGAPLCIEYPDNLTIDGETFTVELWIYVKVGAGFNYVKFHTFSFDDEEMLAAGTDGVVDFVLGNCNLTDPDLQLVPYQNLPATCGLMVTAAQPNALLGCYLDVTLSNIGPGYDLVNGNYGANCFQRGQFIWLNEQYTMDVYGSLRPDLMPPILAALPWDKLNWICNHLQNYQGYMWYDIQQINWKLENPNWMMTEYSGVPAATAIGLQIYNDAMLYGTGFVPLPGGWAAVTFRGVRPNDPDYYVQTVFVRVDP